MKAKREGWLPQKEAKWAEEYIRARTQTEPLSALVGRFKRIVEKESSYDEVMKLERVLIEHHEGRDLMRKLKNALRQRKYRSSKHTFSLPTHTVTSLRHLAKDRQLTAAAMAASLIDNAERGSREESKQLKKLKEELALEREHAKLAADLCKKKFEEAMKQLRNHLQRLAMWETIHGEELPGSDFDEVAIRQNVEKKIKQIEIAIRYAAQEELLGHN